MKDLLDFIIKIFCLIIVVPLGVFAMYLSWFPVTFPLTIILLGLYWWLGG